MAGVEVVDMRKCTSCGKEISASAIACPNCGLPRAMWGVMPLGFPILRIFFGAIPAALFVVAIFLHSKLLESESNFHEHRVFFIASSSIVTVAAYYSYLIGTLVGRWRLPSSVLFRATSFLTMIVLIIVLLATCRHILRNPNPDASPDYWLEKPFVLCFYNVVVAITLGRGVGWLVIGLPALRRIVRCPQCKHVHCSEFSHRNDVSYICEICGRLVKADDFGVELVGEDIYSHKEVGLIEDVDVNGEAQEK